MCKISELLWLLLLIILSVRDIKSRKVSALLLAAAGLASLIYRICIEEMNWLLIAGGAAVGGVFLLISKVTGEGFGYGDSIGIAVLGIFLGFLRILTVLSISFFLLLCVSIPVLWRKKMSKNYSLPFYPFLTAGYLCLIWIERMSL